MRVSKPACNSTYRRVSDPFLSLLLLENSPLFAHAQARSILHTDRVLFARTCPPIPSATSKLLIPADFWAFLFFLNERRLVEDDDDFDDGKRKKKLRRSETRCERRKGW